MLKRYKVSRAFFSFLRARKEHNEAPTSLPPFRIPTMGENQFKIVTFSPPPSLFKQTDTKLRKVVGVGCLLCLCASIPRKASMNLKDRALKSPKM